MTACPSPDASDPQGDRVLVIGGMHRSGTSLLASLFDGAGVSVGARLLGVGNGNDVGHFEDLDFYEFHQRALLGNGLPAEGFTADAIPVVPEPMRAEAKTIVEIRRRQGGVWGWKDPRTILFLEFWADVLPDASFVFVFRSPWEVVDSFFRRGDPAFVYNPALAARVWLHYNRLILRFITRHPERCIIREMTQVSTDPQEVFTAVRDRFGIPLGEPTNRFRPELLQVDRDGFRAALLAASCAEAVDVYHRLRDAAGSSSTLPVDVPMSTADMAVVEWARAARFERENAHVRREWVRIRAEADDELAALQARLASWDAVGTDIQAAVERLSTAEMFDPTVSARLADLTKLADLPRPQAAA